MSDYWINGYIKYINDLTWTFIVFLKVCLPTKLFAVIATLTLPSFVGNTGKWTNFPSSGFNFKTKVIKYVTEYAIQNITLHYEFLEESILFGFQMNVEVFDILNYCILNEKCYIHKQKLFHENALDFYNYLWELKYKLQIERMICNGTNNDEQFSKFLFIYNAL